MHSRTCPNMRDDNRQTDRTDQDRHRSSGYLTVTAVALAMLALPAGQARAQSARAMNPHLSSIAVPDHRAFILPQSRVFAVNHSSPIRITEVTAGVVIVEQAATTTLDIALANPSGARVEAELIVPVPDGAAVRGFSFQGNAREASAQVLAKDEARATYNAIVAKIRDPALLEFAGYNLIRSSVFPVEANGTQKVRLTYEHLLTAEGDRVDYVLPRSESVDYNVPWKVSIRIKSKRSISTVYSPSHRLETVQRQPNVVSVRLAEGASTEPGPLRVSYLLERNGITASLLAYPDPKVGGGYFLLLAGLPARPPEGHGESAIKREITLVFDRSGSMNGRKIEQVRQAALQLIAGLEDDEAFNIITYNDTVDLFSPKSVAKTEASVRAARKYLESINARGGTNIHDALTEALRTRPAEGTLPIVLFLTDGLPTVGQTSEAAIREVATKANPYERRIFTFGVGADVNSPLLQNIARETRATATFVLPTEDVEVKVAGVFKQLTGPVLADARLDIIDASGEPAPQRVREVIPTQLPDLFEGDQLVLLGQYVGDDPLNFRVSGNYRGSRRTFRFHFGLDNATTKNAFVPRLWASRRIGMLVDAIRQLGADGGTRPTDRPGTDDPRMKELVDEIVRISTEFGILTEYTAFLAREGTDLSDRDNVLAEANTNFQTRAVNTRTGLAALNQAFNNGDQVRQAQLNFRNGFWDANMNRVSITNVQQINDRAFYQRHGRWVDSQLVNEENTVKPAKVIEFGSQEFHQLARKLAAEGRQGSISLRGDILLLVDNEPVLVK